jgi:hypothetical protein
MRSLRRLVGRTTVGLLLIVAAARTRGPDLHIDMITKVEGRDGDRRLDRTGMTDGETDHLAGTGQGGACPSVPPGKSRSTANTSSARAIDQTSRSRHLVNGGT